MSAWAKLRGLEAATFRRIEPQIAVVAANGSWRVYFNRHGAAPLLWCVSPADAAWELAVTHVELAATTQTVYRPKAEADEDDGRPSAWLAVDGRLELCSDGRARILPI